MQYLKNRIGRELAEVRFAVLRVDGTEPLGEAAVVARKVLGMVQKLLDFDDRDSLLVEIELMFLVAELHCVAVVLGHFPRVRVEKLEADEVQVFKDGRLVLPHHVARNAGNIEHHAVLVHLAAFVLHLDGNAVARDVFLAVVDNHQVGFRVAAAKFAGNERVHELRIFDAVVADEVQARVDEVGCQGDVLLAREDFLEAQVVVDIDVLVLVSLDDSFCILLVLRFPESLEENCEFVSGHLFFHPERAGSRTGTRPRLLH